MSRRTNNRSKSPSVDESAIILSKFNTVYRHNLLDILTHYVDIPTDPNPENNIILPENNNDKHVLSAPKSNSSSSIYNIKLKSVDFQGLVVSFKVSQLGDMDMMKPIPFEESAKSWSDVENTIIEMAKTAAKSRNLSHLRVSGIMYPTSVFNILLIFLVTLLPFGYFYPSLLYDSFFAKYVPIMLNVQPYHNYIFFLATAAHLIEIYLMLLPLFTKYRVPIDYAIEWTFLSLLDGYESIKRFEAYVETINSDNVYYDFTDTDYLDY